MCADFTNGANRKSPQIIRATNEFGICKLYVCLCLHRVKVPCCYRRFLKKNSLTACINNMRESQEMNGFINCGTIDRT